MRWFDIADELLPPAYKAIKDVYAYAKSLDGECTVWTSYLEQILKNFFVQTCDIQTVEYWEKELDLTPHSGETLDQRREAILEALNNQNAITEPYVRSKIESMFPGCTYRFWFDVENNKPYDLHIEIFTKDVDSFFEFKSWLFKMAPAHIYPIVEFAMESEEVDPKAYYVAITWEKANLGIVSDAPVIEYTITLTAGTGYTLTEQEGSSSPVLPGSSYSFILEFEPGYAAGENFAVKANGNILTGVSNIYTIANIQTSQVVTVEGVEDLGTPQYGLMSDDGDSDFGWVILRDMTIKADPKKDQFFEVSTSQYGLMNGADE